MVEPAAVEEMAEQGREVMWGQWEGWAAQGGEAIRFIPPRHKLEKGTLNWQFMAWWFVVVRGGSWFVGSHKTQTTMNHQFSG